MPPDEMRRRVLIVDDDEDLAESLVDALAPHGYETHVAHSAADALSLVQSREIPVAMLDIRLGAASGVDLLSRLVAERPELVCVMMTAHVDTHTAIAALRRGAYDYFDKSSAPSELLVMLNRCFDRWQLQQEKRTAYEALRLAKEEAEAASRAKSEFLATMSHELRTPLNAVIGFSQIMSSQALGPLGNKQYLEYANDIHASGAHLLELINDILDLSKAEAGKLALVEDLVDLREVANAVCRLLRNRIEEAGLALAVDIPETLPVLYGDERKLKQILLNLLSNAIKFTTAGGRIELTVAEDEPGGLRLEVSDTGIGIAREHLETVLQPFVQVDSSLSRRHAGTGLGLPLAKAMVELHQGRLQLESELGRGTTVRITLPPERIVAASAISQRWVAAAG